MGLMFANWFMALAQFLSPSNESSALIQIFESDFFTYTYSYS